MAPKLAVQHAAQQAALMDDFVEALVGRAEMAAKEEALLEELVAQLVVLLILQQHLGFRDAGGRFFFENPFSAVSTTNFLSSIVCHLSQLRQTLRTFCW